jgi:hypothetical protein
LLHLWGLCNKKKQHRNITEFVKKVYYAYLGVKLGDQSKSWAPHKVCSVCVEELRQWSKGKKNYFRFGVPMNQFNSILWKILTWQRKMVVIFGISISNTYRISHNKATTFSNFYFAGLCNFFKSLTNVCTKTNTNLGIGVYILLFTENLYKVTHFYN